MLNTSYNYIHHSAKLTINGIADFSLGQKEGEIGIISIWKLKIAGYPELEGNKEHLINFINSCYLYSKSILIGENIEALDNNLVKIEKHKIGHKISLTSSKTNVKPLEFTLDDAEFIDLITCIDKLREDKRVLISWKNKEYDKFYFKPKRRILKFSSLISLILGFSSLALFSLIFIYTIPNNYILEDRNEIINNKDNKY